MNKKNNEQVDPELAEFMKEFCDAHKEVMDKLAKMQQKTACLMLSSFLYAENVII